MTRSHNGRRLLIAAALVLQLAAALSLLCYSARAKAYASKHGRIIFLACRAFDPFNPFKGRYVKLGISESQLQGENLDAESLGSLAGGRSKKVYCRMVEGDGGVWKVAGVRRKLPQDAGNDIYIEGRCTSWSGGQDGYYARIEYAFDEYYMQENYARYADNIRWDDFNALEPLLAVYVGKDGGCIQQGLSVKVGGERVAFEEYCRRKLSEQEAGAAEAFAAEADRRRAEVQQKTTYMLSDRQADENARRLYDYIVGAWGRFVLSGQMENAWDDGCNMLARVHADTGRYPALMGFDFMNYTGVAHGGRNVQVERAINFAQGKDWAGNPLVGGKGGIVAFNWHWRDPLSGGRTGEFYTAAGNKDHSTEFRIPYDTANGCWNTGSEGYAAMLEDLDVVAAELSRLRDNGIPVLWRPLHEASGNVGLFPGGKAWFWWGAGTAEDSSDEGCAAAYVALWKLMYAYFTEEKALHNLIWVWNGQNGLWYPGDSYVDIIGTDIYGTARDYGAHASSYESCRSWADVAGSKPVALSETGSIPSPGAIEAEGAWWSWFMVWNDGDRDAQGVTTADSASNFWSGDYYNTAEHKRDVYASPLVVTLDELDLDLERGGPPSAETDG